MEAAPFFGALIILSAMLCFFSTKLARHRFPSLSKPVALIVSVLVASVAGFWFGSDFGEANAIIEGASNAAEEADAGPLVFVAVMIFGILSSIASAVGGAIGTLLAFAKVGKK